MTKKRSFHIEIIKLNLKKEILQYTTPENIADYRAKKLKCNTIVDLCCGIGGQTIYFSRYCKKVYAIDINRNKIKIAKKLCRKLNLKNVELICNDVLDPKIISIIKNADIIFMDPERPIFEEKREMESIHPNINDIISLYSKVSSNFCIELPPQIDINKINYNCEKEFISINNSINRLTIYFGKLKKNEVTAISLSSKYKLSSFEKPINNIKITNIPKKYIYEIDIVIKYSNLFEYMIRNINKDINISDIFLMRIDKNRFLLTSNILISNPFLINKYILLKKIDYKYNFLKIDELTQEINNFLKNINSGIINIRGYIPQELYFSILNKINRDLNSNINIKNIYIYFLE